MSQIERNIIIDLVHVVDANSLLCYFHALLSFFTFIVNLSKVKSRFAFFDQGSGIVSVGPNYHPSFTSPSCDSILRTQAP